MSLKEARKKVSGHEWTTSGSYLPPVLLPGTQIPPVQSYVEKECPRCGLRREAGRKEDDEEEGSWSSHLKRALNPIIKQVCWWVKNLVKFFTCSISPSKVNLNWKRKCIFLTPVRGQARKSRGERRAPRVALAQNMNWAMTQWQHPFLGEPWWFVVQRISIGWKV